MKKEKAIERARKLMAMAADSSSPHEAAIAARRARSVMDEYQVSASDLEEASEFSEKSVGKARMKIPVWEQVLCSNIGKLNDCIVKFDREGRFLFQGFDEDAEVAKFMLLYLTENGKRCCKRHIKEKPAGCRYSFKLGYAEALVRKILEIIESRKQDLKTGLGQSLVVIKKALVEKEFGIQQYKTESRGRPADPTSALAGFIAGQKANVVTGLGSDKRTSIAAA